MRKYRMIHKVEFITPAPIQGVPYMSSLCPLRFPCSAPSDARQCLNVPFPQLLFQEGWIYQGGQK